MKRIADNVIRIPTTLDGGNFFKYWFNFLKPLHGLTNRETEILTELATKRFELSEFISDDYLLDQAMLSSDSRKEIRDKFGISANNLATIITVLRKNKLLIDNKINPRFLPNVKKDDKNFKLLFFFDFE